MKLPYILLVIQARYKILLLAVLVTVGTAVTASLILPKTYKATTTLILNYKGVDPVSGHALSANLMPGYIATQLDIINSMALVMKVIDWLKLTTNERIQKEYQAATGGRISLRDWLADSISKRLDVTPSRQSSVLDISFKDADPQFAADIANTFAQEYQKTAIQINSEPQMRVSNYFKEQTKILRANLEAAHDRLSTYQKEKALVSVDSRYDVESVRLNELSSQLVAVQGQLMDAQSRENQAQKRNSAESPDIIANPLIQSLKASLTQAEARLSQVRTKFMPNHPEYQKAKAEVDQVRTALDRNTRATATSVGNTARILAQRERELRAALEAQRSKVLQANRSRDELAVLNREVESAQRAYDVLVQRFTQTRVEGEANQSDVVVLNRAAVPTRPAFPKLLLNTALSVVLGGLLGLCLIFLAEIVDRRVRSPRELTEVLHAPVLGVIGSVALKEGGIRSLALAIPRRLLPT